MSVKHRGAVAPHEPNLELAQEEFSSIRLLRLRDVLEIIPISRSAWFSGVKAGHFPKGRQLRPRVTVWRSDEISDLVMSIR